MAISTYGELQSEVIERMHRSDLSTRAQASILLATARFSRELRVPEMEAIANTTATSEYTALPIDFMEMRSLVGDDEVLEYRTPFELQRLIQREYNPSVPVYTIADMQIRVHPAPSNLALDVLYYAKIPDFAASNDTNWLLDKYPDAYVECVMVDLCKYVKDYAAAREHEAYVGKFIEDMNRRSRSLMHGTSPMTIRVY